MHSAWMIPLIVSLAHAASPRALVQGGSEPKAAEPRKGDSLVVVGCITGPAIEETDTLRTYRLTGDKAVVKELAKQHVGHVDEVSGTLKSTLVASTARSKQVGKTRITIGAVESRSAPDRGESLPVLAVKSFRHLPGVCTK
jgi:hypothetical protein